MKDFGLKKLYYSISEVSKITGLEQYILRYWETEFEELRPSKNRAGNRIYTNKDIQKILKIKRLLREEKYTIEGAKKVISEIDWDDREYGDIKLQNTPVNGGNGHKPESGSTPDQLKRDLEEIKSFLHTLLNRI